GQREAKARCLADAGWKHHDGVLVEDDLELQAHVADGLDDSRLVWAPCGHDYLSGTERSYAALSQCLDKFMRWRLGEDFLFLGARVVEKCAILGDHAPE